MFLIEAHYFDGCTWESSVPLVLVKSQELADITVISLNEIIDLKPEYFPDVQCFSARNIEIIDVLSEVPVVNAIFQRIGSQKCH